MFKAFRHVVEKTSAGSDEDIADKKKLKDLETAVSTLQRTLQVYLRAFLDLNANAATFHIDVANVYPAGETLSTAVMQLNSSSGVFKDAPHMAEKIRDSLSKPIVDILARIKDLLAKAEERQVIRAEISHYREKVTRLANDGLHNSKAQSKAESNQEKLLSNQTRFKELDHELGEAIGGLDHHVAEVTNAALARFVQLQATYASGLLHCYGNAIAAIPGSLKAGGPPAAVLVHGSAAAAAGGAGLGRSSRAASDDGGAAHVFDLGAEAASADGGAVPESRASMSAFLGGAAEADNGAVGGSGAPPVAERRASSSASAPATATPSDPATVAAHEAQHNPFA